MQVLLPDQNLPSNLAAVVGEKQLKVVNEIENLIKAVEIANDDGIANDERAKGETEVEPLSTTSDEGIKGKLQVESCCPPHKPIHAHTPFPGISQLLPSLYLCGAGAAMPQILDQLQVRFIINVAPELPDTPLSSSTKPLYLRINAYDRPAVDLSSHFDEVADMIEEVRQHDGKSLVHCVAGVSRSATLCIAYLMKHGQMNLRDAYLHVKAIRPQIRPNTGFIQQLRQYEEQLYGTCSVKMIFLESLNKEIPDIYEPEYRVMEEFYQRQRKALKRH